MNFNTRTMLLGLVFASLLSPLGSESLLSRSATIFSSGNIIYPAPEIIIIDFEHPSHFEYGEGTIWDAPTGLGPDYPYNLFIPSNEASISSTTSARLELANPTSDASRRIHVGHAWDPIEDRHIWLTCWIYLPPDFKVDNWVTLFKIIEERYANKSAYWGPSTPGYGSFQIGFGININSKVTETEYRIRVNLNQGWVDEDQDGVNDLPPQQTVVTDGTVRFGEWFKVTVYAFRDLDEGILKFWLNDILQLDLRDIRTIGNSPGKLANPPEGWVAWLDSQIALYSGGEGDWRNVSPKYALFDDVILESGEPG